MSLERSQDYRRVKRLLAHDVLPSSTVYYLVECQNGEDVGVWYFHDWKDGAMIHTNMKPEYRGRAARESGKAALCWMFENTSFRKIYAMVPEGLKQVNFIAVWIGMTFMGTEDGHRCYVVEA